MATTLANISIKDSSSWNTYLNLIYPVGSYYLSNTSTSPGSRFGGTWTQIKDQRFLCGYSSITSGGANSVTLTTNQMPSHTHKYGNYYSIVYNFTDVNPIRPICSGTDTSGISSYYNGLQSTGGGKSHENRPLFRTCYMWYRTA